MKRAKKIIISSIITGLSLGTYSIQKWVRKNSAPPRQPKSCDFIYPETSNTNISSQLKSLEPLYTKHFNQKGGTDNDASCLNKTNIYGRVEVHSDQEVLDVLDFAKKNDLSITAAGQQHTMGGQALNSGGIIMDMKPLNQIEIDTETKILTVQSGATWEEIQIKLDPLGLSVHSMQSINIFTVGGTISVNAHGMDHQPGSIAPTIKALTVVLASGEIKRITPKSEPQLFKNIIGGYGLFGIILEAEIQVVDNEAYLLESNVMDYRDFADFYKNKVSDNKDVGLFYGRLSVAPQSYLTEAIAHRYIRLESEPKLPPVKKWENTTLSRFVVNTSKSGSIGRWLRWMLEKHVAPKLHTCITRNQVMSERETHCIVSRNQEMADSMGYLKNNLVDTDILNEYFVPPKNMVLFVDGMRDIIRKNKSNLLNVSIRIVQKDSITALPYAKEDMFAYVLYFNQKLDKESSKNLTKTTQELIDLALRLDGTFYLPYQTVYSDKQLESAYPGIKKFWQDKQLYDPKYIFRNKWFDIYSGNQKKPENI